MSRIRRWSNLGRWGERLYIWPSLPSRVLVRYHSLLCWWCTGGGSSDESEDKFHF